MSRRWTDEQIKAFSIKDCNLLVSAAAGSGKTAVLIQRILSKLLDEDNSINVNNLLVVTFTDAAAAEMKEKVRVSIDEHLEELEAEIENKEKLYDSIFVKGEKKDAQLSEGKARFVTEGDELLWKDGENLSSTITNLKRKYDHLREQSVLVYHGNISTIHGFCLEVIRNHFHEIDIEPGFRIGEAGELTLLRQDVMEKLLEAKYAEENNQEFFDFVEKYGNGRDDKDIEAIILKLYDYSMSTPDPTGWLEKSVSSYTAYGAFEAGEDNEVCEIRETYEAGEDNGSCEVHETCRTNKTCGTIEETSFYPALSNQVDLYLDAGINYLKEGLKSCDESDGPWMHKEILEDDLAFLEKVKGLQPFNQRKEAFKEYNPMALSRKRDEGVSPEKRKGVGDLRNVVKDKIIGKLIADYYSGTEEEVLMELENCQKEAKVLIQLAYEFAELFNQAKRTLNILDFNDMEHLALRILTTKKDGKLEPTRVAKEYQNKFEEVMIDEYQDSNLIQEAILTAVSRSACSKRHNNIFMVGDVKQSIYRFRLSVPELFMEKYNTYTDDASDNRRVMLYANFRSRPPILTSVNEIFKGIMEENVGGITYDDRVALYPGLGLDFEELEDRKVHHTELLISGTWENDEESVIVNRIQELMEKGWVLNEKYEELKNEERSVKGGTAKEEVVEESTEKTAKDETVEGESVERKSANGKFRRVQYKDIVILLRTMKGSAEKLAKYLTDNGIPVHYGSQEGYFDVYEVSVLLDYLRVINNGREEIPLTAVLTSPFVGLSSDELATIKRTFPEVPFYQGVWQYAKLAKSNVQEEYSNIGQEQVESKEQKEEIKLEQGQMSSEFQIEDSNINYNLARKLEKFHLEIEGYRQMLPYLGIHELLWRITGETGYALAIKGMVSGNQRSANVEMLIEKAAAFEQTSYKGIFHFIRYIEEMKKYKVEFGEASIADEQSDVVRIMSIHKSKGLQFPIVILAGMSKQFYLQDLNDKLLIHSNLGIGLDDVNLEKRTIATTILKNVIKNQMQEEKIGELLRVLYVAMTRAKEKLIMTGNLKEKDFLLLEEKLDGGRGVPSEKNRLNFHQVITARSFMDWVLPMVTIKKIDASVELRLYSPTDIERSKRSEEIKEQLTKEILTHWNKEQVFNQELRDHFLCQLNYHYPYQEAEKMKFKFTVSELKKRSELKEGVGELLIEEPQIIPLLPKFIGEGKKLSGITRGNAYHLLMENLDFEKEYSLVDIEDLKKTLVESQKMEKGDATLINNKEIIAFLETDLAKRMGRAKKANNLYEEQPFVIHVDASEIYPKEMEPGEETILIQGIVDLWFEEEDGIVLVDYKTDRVENAEELKQGYEVQLGFYKRALEQLTGKKVKEKLIYSFNLQQMIEI